MSSLLIIANLILYYPPSPQTRGSKIEKEDGIEGTHDKNYKELKNDYLSYPSAVNLA
jgi:hypothetical protein